MKKIIVLIAINILLLGIALNVTNENDIINKKDLEIGKTYVDKNNDKNKIVLYGDYSAEIISCNNDDVCISTFGSFTINEDQLNIIVNDQLSEYQIKELDVFTNNDTIYILE